MPSRRLPDKLEAWVTARKRFHLSHAQVQMARELGLNPDKLGKLANHDQEPWKLPLPQFIEHLYEKRFGREVPETVRSVEEGIKRAAAKKTEKRVAKASRRVAGAVDRDRLRAALRGLDRDALLDLAVRAVDCIAPDRLAEFAAGLVPPEALRLATDLLIEVRQFNQASLEGEYYESFDVNSPDFMGNSRGTDAWIAECRRLFDRCLLERSRTEVACLRAALEMLFDLLRQIDRCEDDVVFWADEGGSWAIGLDWEKILPVWLHCLAQTAEPEEFSREALRTINDFTGSLRHNPYVELAFAAATPEQQRALEAAPAT